MKKLFTSRIAVIFFLLLPLTLLNAQTRSLTPDDLFKIKNVNETIFSPDGKM